MTEYRGCVYTSEVVAEMRDRVEDVTWDDLDPEDLDELDDATIISGVDHNYQGGIDQFLDDSGILTG